MFNKLIHETFKKNFKKAIQKNYMTAAIMGKNIFENRSFIYIGRRSLLYLSYHLLYLLVYFRFYTSDVIIDMYNIIYHFRLNCMNSIK